MVIAVSSYCFHGLVQAGDVTILDAPRLAREAGGEAVELAVGGSLGDPLSMDLAWALHRRAEEAGVAVSSVVVAAELLEGTPDEREDAIEATIAQLDAAAAIGVRRFRHDASWGPASGDFSDAAFEDALPILRAGCRRIAERAAELGARSSIENHGRFVQHADRVRRLVEAVDHPAFGVTLDIGNGLWADQDLVEAARRLASHAITVHVKDFHVDPPGVTRAWDTRDGGPRVVPCAIGEGDVDVRGCLAAVRDAGVTVPHVVEYEGWDLDPREGARRGVTTLRALLQRL